MYAGERVEMFLKQNLLFFTKYKRRIKISREFYDFFLKSFLINEKRKKLKLQNSQQKYIPMFEESLQQMREPNGAVEVSGSAFSFFQLFLETKLHKAKCEDEYSAKKLLGNIGRLTVH